MSDFEEEFILEAIDEVSDNLDQFYEIVTKLEKNAEVDDLYNEIFRLIHNIKGNSSSAGFEVFSSVVHELETKLLPFRDGEKTLISTDVEVLATCYTFFGNYLEEIKKNREFQMEFSPLMAEIEKFGNNTDQCDTDSLLSLNVESKNELESENESFRFHFLVVDDEVSLCEILNDHLTETYNSKVFILHDGEAAFEACKENQYDLIITDYHIPKLNGLDFLEKIRKGNTKNKNTPVIFSSGYNPMLTPDSDLWDNVLILNKVFTFEKLNFHINCLLKAAKKSA